ncbi:MAG: glycosyltransferase family 39 protein [Candidatus Aureabacteria bacterium]|nr:glycosyltransferase family 39 protein [Candidatus Auribacterota bacterium]
MTEITTAPLSIPPWVIVLCLLPLLFGVHGHQPWTPDKPREAEIARGMAEDGPWLIPHLAGRPFVEKPPLYYWAATLMVRAAGGTVAAATAVRMVSAWSAAATLLLLWIVGRSILGARRAVIALVILATSYGFVLAAHWINLDPLLMFLVAAAVLLFFQGVERGADGDGLRDQRRAPALRPGRGVLALSIPEELFRSVVAKAKKGPRRIFFLLHGVPAKEKEIPNIGNTNEY